MRDSSKSQTEELLKKLVERSEHNCKSLEKEPDFVPAPEYIE
jgi:hypothetical protein